MTAFDCHPNNEEFGSYSKRVLRTVPSALSYSKAIFGPTCSEMLYTESLGDMRFSARLFITSPALRHPCKLYMKARFHIGVTVI
jgi:hypothetical protein